MQSLKVLLRTGLFAGLLVSLFPATSFAAIIGFDSGIQLNDAKPFDTAQPIANPYDSQLIYGKLEGAAPFDIYKFTADKDGEQTFSLLAVEPPTKPDVSGYPILFFVDPTTATRLLSVGLPLPDSRYHYSGVTIPEVDRYTNEPLVGQQYKVLNEQTIELAKGTTYYLVVAPRNTSLITRYAIHLGEDQVWDAASLFKNFGSWWRVQTGVYSGTSGFTLNLATGLIVLSLLGFSLLSGVTLMQELVAWSANRNKASGFLLIKMQPVVRIIQWFSLLIWMVSSWFYMSRFTGWIGVPFVLSIVAVAIFILTLVGTLWLSPRIEKLEVTTREATIPVALRKRWFVYSLITLVLYAGMYAMMAILATRTVGL